jgi:hypothetical protein
MRRMFQRLSDEQFGVALQNLARRTIRGENDQARVHGQYSIRRAFHDLTQQRVLVSRLSQRAPGAQALYTQRRQQ